MKQMCFFLNRQEVNNFFTQLPKFVLYINTNIAFYNSSPA